MKGVGLLQHVIIGNSAAGVRAAETLRALDPEAKIIIIAKENHPAYSRCLLPDLLAGSRDELSLQIRSDDFYVKNNIQTLLGKKANSVDPLAHKVNLEGGSSVSYDKLLIATGASSFMPPMLGINNPNVFALRDLRDAKNILKAIEKARRVVIVGGGFVGLEAAYALYHRGLEVTIVEKMPHILPHQFDAQAAEILKRDMQAEGIRFILGRGIKEIAAPGLWGRLFGRPETGVILEDGERLKADVILISIGTRANIEVIKDTEILVNQGIPVNDFMETTLPDIYAAGDVAETKDAVTGKIGLTPIWPNATTQGRIAAYNMAGIKKAYTGLIGMQNAVEFREVPAIALGITQPVGDEYEILQDYRSDRNLYKKLVFRKNILVGMILVGRIEQAGIYGALIKKKQELKLSHQVLMRDDFSYAHLYP